MTTFDRERFLTLLESLSGSEDPAVQEVLTYMATIPIGWEQVIVSPQQSSGLTQEVLESDRRLIATLLKNESVSADTLQELESLLADIKDGSFTESDHRYLSHLQTRLNSP